jgi:hypothetical protein
VIPRLSADRGVRVLATAEMAGIHEGPEYGVGDFVLLHDVTLDAFMDNLQLR